VLTFSSIEKRRGNSMKPKVDEGWAGVDVSGRTSFTPILAQAEADVQNVNSQYWNPGPDRDDPRPVSTAHNLNSVMPVLFLLFSLMIIGCQGEQKTLGSDLRNIEIRAVVSANKSLTVSAPSDGKASSIQVREGILVKQGEPLMVLTNPIVERDYEFARAQTMLAQSRFRSAQSGTFLPSAGSGQESLNRERAMATIVENKRAKLERYRQLRKGNDVSKQELEDAENEHAWAVRDYLNESALRAAPSGPSGDRAVALAELQKAQADESAARQRREAMQIVAPISGSITAVRITEGQSVYARDALVEIADLSSLKVRGEISPELITLASAGRVVEVKVFSVPPRTFRAQIDYVVANSGSVPGGGATVVVTIPNARQLIQPSTPARISIRF